MIEEPHDNRDSQEHHRERTDFRIQAMLYNVSDRQRHRSAYTDLPNKRLNVSGGPRPTRSKGFWPPPR